MPLTPPRQLSLFGVEAAEPGPADLAGLLAGPGQVERMGGTARVSVVVDAAWRVHVLVAELAARGLTASWEVTAGSGLAVRTAYTTVLAPLAAAWLSTRPADGMPGVCSPAPGWYLDGPRLRLWVAAAGSREQLGFVLRLGSADEATWGPIGAALAAVGLPAVLVVPRAGTRTAGGASLSPSLSPPDGVPAGPPIAAPAAPVDAPARTSSARTSSAGTSREGTSREGTESDIPDEDGSAGGRVAGAGDAAFASGPAYRITGRRRLARLAELVGDRPAAAPPTAWP